MIATQNISLSYSGKPLFKNVNIKFTAGNCYGIIGGLFPVVSHKNACFLRSEVAGIAMDDAVADAYAGLDRAQGEALAVRLCAQAAARIAPFVDGYYIMTPFQRVALACRVMEAVRGL